MNNDHRHDGADQRRALTALRTWLAQTEPPLNRARYDQWRKAANRRKRTPRDPDQPESRQ